MQKKYATIAAFMLLSQFGFAQLHFSIGMNLGGSKLYHNTEFRTTVLFNDYLETEELIRDWFEFNGWGDPNYTWEDFKRSAKLNSSFLQPRMGFSASLRYREWPVVLIAEAMSSTSSYEKMAYAGTLALGKNFDLGESDYFITAFGGYKFVKDLGFGSKTLVNSIGNKKVRENLAVQLGAETPLGPQKGKLFSLRLGIGKTFGVDDQLTAGIEAIGELDLTDKLKRQSRMTNVVVQVYGRFDFEFNWRRRVEYYPNPAGGKRH